MKAKIEQTDTILLIGNDDLTVSIAMCLLNAGHSLDVCTKNTDAFQKLLRMHFVAGRKHRQKLPDLKKLSFCGELPVRHHAAMAIAVTNEEVAVKRELISRLGKILDQDSAICINSESISLHSLQHESINPNRIIGLNWTEPAHTTFFLEVVSSKESFELASQICFHAKVFWGKDPYIVEDTGIRSRLISAMAREASFLVDNGYASVEDIDRACRNDAGYYLPFSGNGRYMDLMGTYAYGMVMKDLNQDLSKSKELPEFMKNILASGGLGMENKKGFYNYSDASVENWKKTMEKFSYEIHAIIEKYPFNYTEETFTE